jgi:hypothetical protein
MGIVNGCIFKNPRQSYQKDLNLRAETPFFNI